MPEGEPKGEPKLVKLAPSKLVPSPMQELTVIVANLMSKMTPADLEVIRITFSRGLAEKVNVIEIAQRLLILTNGSSDHPAYAPLCSFISNHGTDDPTLTMDPEVSGPLKELRDKARLTIPEGVIPDADEIASPKK